MNDVEPLLSEVAESPEGELASTSTALASAADAPVPPWADPQSFLLIPMGVVGLFAARMASIGMLPTSAALAVWFLFYLNSGIVEHRQEELSALYRGALVGVAGLCVALTASVDWMWLTWAMAIIAYAIAAVATYIWRSFRG
jgi:hypothetical protein